MEYSNNKIVNQVLKYIGPDSISTIDTFVRDSINRKYIEFDNEKQLNSFFNEYLKKFNTNHNEEDILTIRKYTGYEFSNINAVLRGNWNYEVNGILTEKKEKEIRANIYHLSTIINDLEQIPYNIKTYRGVDLSSFNRYRVNSLEDLLALKGQFLYEEGFTSTSMLKSRSFFDRDLEYHKRCNIEIEYLIPEEVSEVIPLITDDLSYSKYQSELLINKGSLSKIIDVKLSDDMKKAYIKAIIVPRVIYDKKVVQNSKNKGV